VVVPASSSGDHHAARSSGTCGDPYGSALYRSDERPIRWTAHTGPIIWMCGHVGGRVWPATRIHQGPRGAGSCARRNIRGLPNPRQLGTRLAQAWPAQTLKSGHRRGPAVQG
jgi:hypothetical protein